MHGDYCVSYYSVALEGETYCYALRAAILPKMLPSIGKEIWRWLPSRIQDWG